MENQNSKQNVFFEKLETLLLCYKGVQTLPSFQARKLQKILIEGNSIKNIDSIAESDYPFLKSYTVKKNSKITRIPLIEAPNLQKLQIKENKRSNLLANTHLFKIYSNLKEAQISGISFQEPIEIKPIADIEDQKQEQKDLQNQGQEQNTKHQLEKVMNFKKYDKYLQNNQNLIQQAASKNFSLKIELSQNIIKTLPCFGFREIKKFYCKSNSIESIEHFSQGEYPSLEIIDMSFNLIKKVPKLILPSVKNIDFSNNKIQTIGQFSDGEYLLLQTIEFCKNSIKVLPCIKAPLLERIGLEKNQIQDAERFFAFPYQKITSFNLSNQRLENVKEINFSELEELNLASNRLKQIPILRTPKLRFLKVNSNSINHAEALESKELRLKKLEIQDNYISYLPMLNTTLLEYLNISNNNFKNFEKFAALEFPKLQNLQMQGIYRYSQQKIQIPKLKMPMIQVLNFENSQTFFESSFFESPFEVLRQLKLGKCKNLTKIPKFIAPKLEIFQINQTSIDDMSEFEGDLFFCSLIDLRVSQHINLMLGPFPTKNYEQIILNKRTSRPIVPINLSCDTRFFKSKPELKLRELQIDLSLVNNTEFLAFLNMTEVRQITIKNCHFETGLIRNLNKIDFNSFPKLKRITIKENQKVSFLSFDDSISWDEMLFVERDSLWRRSYCPKNQIDWKIENVQITEGWRKNNLSLQFRNFQERLTGKIYQNQLMKVMKKKSQFGRNLNRHRNLEDNEDEFFEIQRFRRRAGHQWQSPQMFKGYPPTIRYGFEFNQQFRVRQLTQRFFSNLRCRLAGRYMGQERYWRFIDFGQCGGGPLFYVQTIDGRYAQFHISLRMMKITGKGVYHFLEKNVGWRTQQNGQVCIDCLIEVDRLVREIYEIERKPCPLSPRNQIIEELQWWANRNTTEIKINMNNEDQR